MQTFIKFPDLSGSAACAIYQCKMLCGNSVRDIRGTSPNGCAFAGSDLPLHPVGGEGFCLQHGPHHPPGVVIIGAGFAGIEVAKSLEKSPVSVTVIDRRNYNLFQPLLYQVATAALSARDMAVPIRSLLRAANTEILMDEVTDVDLAQSRLCTASGRDMRCRLAGAAACSICIGTKPSALVPIAAASIWRRQVNSCAGRIPCARATCETVRPGFANSATSCCFSSAVQRHRRSTGAITSARAIVLCIRSPYA